jgi:hypothetical protein
MTKNMGNTDKSIRIVLAIIFAILTFTGVVTGPLAVALWVLAAVFVLTSLISFCPLYLIFGWNTCPATNRPGQKA